MMLSHGRTDTLGPPSVWPLICLKRERVFDIVQVTTEMSVWIQFEIKVAVLDMKYLNSVSNNFKSDL